MYDIKFLPNQPGFSCLLATFQPLMFENIVTETLHMLREMTMNAETEKRKVKSSKSNQLIPTIRYRTDKCD